MSNIRIGGKTYRDVEKMSRSELEQIGKEIYKRSTVLQKQAKGMGKHHGNLRQQALILAEIGIMERRLKLIEYLVKQREADEQTAQAPTGA